MTSESSQWCIRIKEVSSQRHASVQEIMDEGE